MRVGAAACAALVLTACSQPVDLTRQSPPTLGEEPGGYESARVTRVVDGDTIEVTITARIEGAGAGRARRWDAAMTSACWGSTLPSR